MTPYKSSPMVSFAGIPTFMPNILGHLGVIQKPERNHLTSCVLFVGGSLGGRYLLGDALTQRFIERKARLTVLMGGSRA